MLISVSELNFETDIISEIKALEFHLTAPAPGLALLMLDDRGSPEEPMAKLPSVVSSHWAVSRHLFRAERYSECGSSNSVTALSSGSRI